MALEKNPRKVWVKWHDAMAMPKQWIEPDEIEAVKPDDLDAESVGFLIRIDKEFIVLAISLTEGFHGSVLILPTGMIISVKDLETGEEVSLNPSSGSTHNRRKKDL